MEFFKKIKKLINRDVAFEDEVNQFYIMMRVFYIITGIYILLFDISMICIGAYWMLPILIPWFALHVLGFFSTYHYRRRVVFHMFSAGMLIWIILSVGCFGWDYGAQYFLYPLLLISFFATYQNRWGKVVYTVCIGLLQMSLYIYTRGHEPVIILPVTMEYVMQAVLLMVLFTGLFVICYMFSNTSQASLQKLSIYSEKLKQEAETDLLTGLINRRSMYQILEDAIKNSRDTTFSIAMGDIDFFKNINDTKGHNFGDEVLRQISRYFKEYMKDKGIACRWGGEEFLFLFRGMNGDEAYGYVNAMRKYLRGLLIEYKDESASVTMTFGIEEYDFSSNITELIKKADDKLYLGKNGGRNQVIY